MHKTPIRRDDVEALRHSLKYLGMVVAEIDSGLRYRWIENPHPDFEPSLVVGKRDDELISGADAAAIMALKRKVLASGQPSSQTIPFNLAEGTRYYTIFAYPIIEPNGRKNALLTIALAVPTKHKSAGDASTSDSKWETALGTAMPRGAMSLPANGASLAA